MKKQEIPSVYLSYDLFRLMRELSKTLRQISYFSPHLPRCRQHKYVIRLTLILATKLAYSVILIAAISVISKEIMNRLFPTFKKEVLLLPSPMLRIKSSNN